MLVATIRGPTIQDIDRQIEKANGLCDLFELRCDLFDQRAYNYLPQIISQYDHSFMLTLRFDPKFASKNLIKKEITKLASLSPAYLDIDSSLKEGFFEEINDQFPHVKLIASTHHLSSIDDLEKVYQKMPQRNVFGYKIASFVKTPTEALSMMSFLEGKKNLTLVAMGENRSWARILGACLGNMMTYAAVEKRGEEGQLLLEEVVHIYKFRSLNKKTKIYALLGDPLDQSVGHLFHNQAFSQDSVYVKVPTKKDELHTFFRKAKGFPFYGLSITMPLKEEILPLLDELDEDVKKSLTTNTISRDTRGWKGWNTDGIAALDLIEEKIKISGRKIIVFGNGGFARSVIFEAKKRGAEILVVHRGSKRAEKVLVDLQVQGRLFDDFFTKSLQADVYIQATPSAFMQEKQKREIFSSSSVVLDAVLKKETIFLKQAQEENNLVINGFDLFEKQAKLQQQIWKGSCS